MLKLNVIKDIYCLVRYSPSSQPNRANAFEDVEFFLIELT